MLRLQRGRKGLGSATPSFPPLIRYVHKNFVLHFDDDGSHYSGSAAPFDYYGRAVDIKVDGSRVASRWGSFGREITSDGMHVGDILRPYVFAPIETTGPSVTFLCCDPFNPARNRRRRSRGQRRRSQRTHRNYSGGPQEMHRTRSWRRWLQFLQCRAEHWTNSREIKKGWIAPPWVCLPVSEVNGVDPAT